MDQIKIGKFIAKTRKEKNLTQRELATRLNVTDRAISKWENGRGLPNLSLLESLCRELGISINELLKGEYIRQDNIDKIINENIFDVLSSREREIKKRRLFVAAICVLVCILIVLMSFNTTIFYNTLRGEGYTYFSAQATSKAERVADLIIDGKYEKAATLIGFEGQDREFAEKQWIDSMNALSQNFKIEHLAILKATADDWFIDGDAMLVIYDPQSNDHYIFHLSYTPQDNGIAFGIYSTDDNSRKTELCQFIDNALCTWYAG